MSERNNIIPAPFEFIECEGSFTLSGSTVICGKVSQSIYSSLKLSLEKFHNLSLTESERENNSICFSYDFSMSDKESYRLEVKTSRIIITAADDKGLFYGIQTLIQLIGVNKSSKYVIPSVVITDKPRFQWRGMHLDVSRHFFPVEFIKKYIDSISMLKFNIFHWHLVDDQGWRIEIKRYPMLTDVGAYRIGKDGKKYGGYYSQEEIKDVVQYASERNVTVVPEIEMPGHSLAVLAAYPELSCTGGPFEIREEWGVFDDVYCAGKESTFKFLENVLIEVIDMFPSEYLHIGGDECPKTRWESCPLCRKRIVEENLKDSKELQSYFLNRMSKFIRKYGKVIIGWDEIMEGQSVADAVIMAWRGFDKANEALTAGHNVILSPTSHCYFDHYQSTSMNEPKAWGGFNPIENVCDFDPSFSLPDQYQHKILGGQGNVWTEYMDSENQVEYMVFPRAAALAEKLWSNKADFDYPSFLSRLESMKKVWLNSSVNFRR